MDETFYFAYYKKNEHMILFVPIFVPKLNQWYIDNNYRAIVNHRQTLSHNAISSTRRHKRGSNSQFSW
jgi:hypothetical protein